MWEVTSFSIITSVISPFWNHHFLLIKFSEKKNFSMVLLTIKVIEINNGNNKRVVCMIRILFSGIVVNQKKNDWIQKDNWVFFSWYNKLVLILLVNGCFWDNVYVYALSRIFKWHWYVVFGSLVDFW